jgi:hypothetical protein
MKAATDYRAPSATIIVGLCAVFLVGVFLRLPRFLFSEHASLHALQAFHPQPGFTGIGF